MELNLKIKRSMGKTDITLKQIEALSDKKLMSVNQKLDKVDEKLDRHAQSLEAHTESLVKIERDRKILKDIWEFIKSHTNRLNDHEKRITQLESPSKF
jgi:hypothetical protein